LENFKSISVTRTKGSKSLKISNPTSYKVIGQGKQGAVFQLTPQQCVKIFANPKQAKKEIRIMKELEGLPFMPKTFETGPNYIVMEFVKGVPIDQYLKEKGTLSNSLTKQIIVLVKAMKQYNKTNVENKHVLVTEEGVVKKIDHGSKHFLDNRNSAPYKIFRTLDKLNLLDTFLNQVKEIEPQLYEDWKKQTRKSG
jgi:RIO-like serine/threonine protein kinase